MPRNIPSLKVKQLVRMLESAGCEFYREGKGDHRLYVRYVGQLKRVVPIDMGEKEFSHTVCSENSSTVWLY
jgi:predicted RNA binding protein YcfA (HicA-like mRNA interferase family)